MLRSRFTSPPIFLLIEWSKIAIKTPKDLHGLTGSASSASWASREACWGTGRVSGQWWPWCWRWVWGCTWYREAQSWQMINDISEYYQSCLSNDNKTFLISWQKSNIQCNSMFIVAGCRLLAAAAADLPFCQICPMRHSKDRSILTNTNL